MSAVPVTTWIFLIIVNYKMNLNCLYCATDAEISFADFVVIFGQSNYVDTSSLRRLATSFIDIRALNCINSIILCNVCSWWLKLQISTYFIFCHFFVYLTGLEIPLSCGYFVINAPHRTFRCPAYENTTHDPFPRWKEVTMEKEDVLLVTRPKSGVKIIKLFIIVNSRKNLNI